MSSRKALLALADGTLVEGQSVGADGCEAGELVFNTSMTGYQEIITDPSYKRQIILFTSAHIGNVGVNVEDEESANCHCAGLVIRDLPREHSNWRSTQSLQDYLQERSVVAIAGVDTRKLTRLLRDGGAQNACIQADSAVDPERALALARDFSGLQGMDLAREVTASEPYQWNEGVWSLQGGYFCNEQQGHRVVVYDYGVKRNILRMLTERGCQVQVVPATTTAEQVLQMQPEGVFLSNGPGDPAACDYAISAIQTLMQESSLPIGGICLGHQLLGLACGAQVSKMSFGHHGANHPVRRLRDSRVMITSQNHGFTISDEQLPETLEVTHRSLFDNTVQGFAHRHQPIISFQGHPEASPGPQDAGAAFFDDYVALLQIAKDHAQTN